MNKSSKGHKVALDPALHKALKAKSLVSGIPVSDLVNEAICEEMVEDFRRVENQKVWKILRVK